MHETGSQDWRARHQTLLERAKQLKARSVVDRQELVALQGEIRKLESRIDRPLPAGTLALRALPSVEREQSSRAPTLEVEARPRRRCPFGSCDGSGWHLHETEDAASPCRCQRLPRDFSARRQTSRILRRHLALNLDVPPLAELEPRCIEALRQYTEDLPGSVSAGHGLWLANLGDCSEAACAFIAGEALRREIPVLLYPGDELIGRLRRLAVPAVGQVNGANEEIYDRLATVDLLLINGFDEAAAPARYPERSDLSVSERENESTAATILSHGEGGTSEPVLYSPGMTATDLSRLFQILDQRLMNERATVITTSSDASVLEERLLCVPGEWPSVDYSDDASPPRPVWDESSRRASELRRLLSRMIGLCGPPLVASQWLGSVRARRQSKLDAAHLVRAAPMSAD